MYVFVQVVYFIKCHPAIYTAKSQASIQAHLIFHAQFVANGYLHVHVAQQSGCLVSVVIIMIKIVGVHVAMNTCPVLIKQQYLTQSIYFMVNCHCSCHCHTISTKGVQILTQFYHIQCMHIGTSKVHKAASAIQTYPLLHVVHLLVEAETLTNTLLLPCVWRGGYLHVHVACFDVQSYGHYYGVHAWEVEL